MAFIPYNPGTGTDHSCPVAVTMADSVTIAVGEAVKTSSTGYITNATAGAGLLGIVVGFCNADGTPLSPTAYTAGTATSTDVQSVTTGSSNTYKAIVETSVDKRYSVNSNGTVGTTNASNKIGARIDVDSANTTYSRVLETTATRTSGTVANFFVWGVDPNSSSRLIVSISSSELFNKQG